MKIDLWITGGVVAAGDLDDAEVKELKVTDADTYTMHGLIQPEFYELEYPVRLDYDVTKDNADACKADFKKFFLEKIEEVLDKEIETFYKDNK